jgi:glucose-1-phosphate cytidylyltransferase
MKAVILAGGLGSRLSEETATRPKPMVEIGGMPIIWHIMKIYSSYGIDDFIICLGYKGAMIREFFSQYYLLTSDVTFDLATNTVVIHEKRAEDWRVTLVDTGQTSNTGGRLKRIWPYLKDERAFCFTYGDGLADINIRELASFHERHGRMATVTGVNPPSRFGALDICGDTVKGFFEKPAGQSSWINGGFFVLSPKVLDLIEGDDTVWEYGPLPRLAAMGELRVFFHRGFWQPMDTLRDRVHLEDLWGGGLAPWKIWA